MTEIKVPKPKRGCQVQNCPDIHKGHGYCNRHLKQINQYGYIKRTKYDPNTFDFKGNTCLIGLFGKECKKIATAIIDASDYDLVKDKKWFFKKGNSGDYVVSGCKENYISLSRFIVDAKEGEEVDHEDHDLLNNRRLNLRVCTKAQNQFNSLLRKDNTSGTKGISWHKKEKCWRAAIQENKIQHQLGRFKSFEEAKAAVNEARKELHGQFANSG